MAFENDGKCRESPLANILRGAAIPPQAERTGLDDARGSIVDGLGCFGWLGSARDRAEALELQLKTGRIAALPYAWIDFAEFDPSEGITLHARGSEITIRGRNLNKEVRPGVRLFQGIAARRVPWVRESERGEDLLADQGATVVEWINW